MRLSEATSGHLPANIDRFTYDRAAQQIGQLLQDEKLFANGAINLLTVRYRTRDGGAIGLYYGHRLYAQVNFPAGLDTLLETSNIAAREYEFTTSGIGGTWMTELGISYGKMFGSLTEPVSSTT